MKLYTIYDTIAKDSCKPFGAKNNGVAYRIFLRSMEDFGVKENEYDQLKLYLLGEYNMETMEVIVYPIKEEIMSITEVEDEQ